ncbi:hypothetical protein EVAR_14386_1 [Eumeta japonica]|uniref:Uncharacterized protein n=1 Tax=Eumeta variegata TaxID=151549 RepID=A0A4C1TYE3_EUMVA|nr:hypothetical protein EVAR_14386_1 [Eumeta japonica]
MTQKQIARRRCNFAGANFQGCAKLSCGALARNYIHSLSHTPTSEVGHPRRPRAVAMATQHPRPPPPRYSAPVRFGEGQSDWRNVKGCCFRLYARASLRSAWKNATK